MHTQVAIIGAGPAGLLLAHLLHLEGIESVVVDTRSRSHIEERIRAGVLEHNTVELLKSAGVGARMQAEGLAHTGFELLFDGTRHRFDLTDLTDGRHIVVYGQHEVVRDLIQARLHAELPLYFEVEDTRLTQIEGSGARVDFRHNGQAVTLHCDFIAGCDGFHGISRPAIRALSSETMDRVYPFGWLGILAAAAPTTDELIYARHDDGFALFSMRSPTITRLYLQCAPDEDIEAWPDARIWDELDRRLATHDGWHPARGAILQKNVTQLRSFVCERMQRGRLFLAGDAAHIVPPTGAKGMNLAVADVRELARALVAHYRDEGDARLDAYSTTCLKRVWRALHFSYWMTSILHRFAGADAFAARLQQSELRYIVTSRSGARVVAENYVGLPFDA